MSIPLVIHQIWLGGGPPQEVHEWMRTWQSHHPDWNHVLWTDETRPKLRNERAFQRATSQAMRADILRYELLLDHGGVYVDADFECHRCVRPLVDSKDLMLVSEFGIVSNNIIGSVAGHEFMQHVVGMVGLRTQEASDAEWQAPHVLTGPFVIDQAFVELDIASTRPESLISGDYFFRPRSRVPEILSRGDRKRFATHHAHASWRREGWRDLARSTKLRTRIRRFVDLSVM